MKNALIAAAYSNHERQNEIRKAVREDAGLRFSGLNSNQNDESFVTTLAAHTVRFTSQVAQSRSVLRF